LKFQIHTYATGEEKMRVNVKGDGRKENDERKMGRKMVK
jgi:hypothetical protein